MSPFSIVLASCLATAPLMVMADGLTVPAGGLGGAGWQARMELDSSLPSSLSGLSGFTTVTPSGLQTARLLGDYPLEALRFNQTSNLRVTSGLLLNQRFGPLGNADGDSRNAWPYLGLGLSGNGVRGDWGFQADFGLAAQSLGAAMRLGRVLNGGLSVGDAVRDLRLQPVVRLGMNYSF